MRAGSLMKAYLFFTIGIVTVALVSCAPRVKTRMLVPAKCHQAAKCKRIAVLAFEGPNGNQISADIEALLVGIRVQDSAYFRVIERGAVEKVLEEQMLHQTGVVDQGTAAEVGKLLGANAMVMGVVTQNTTADRRYHEQRSKCTARNEKGKCLRWRKYNVRCIERNAYFSFTPKVVRVSTGEILTSEILTGHAIDVVCRGSERALENRQTLLARAKSQAIEKFRETVAPYYVDVHIKLITRDETRMSSEIKKKIDAGVKWVETGRLDRACEVWNEAHNLHPAGYAICYLLGVCAELSGNLEGALGYYEKADRNTGSPVAEISEALGRVKVNIEKERQLADELATQFLGR